MFGCQNANRKYVRQSQVQISGGKDSAPVIIRVKAGKLPRIQVITGKTLPLPVVFAK